MRTAAKALALLFALGATGSAAAGELSPDRRAELAHLLRHDCGACHGLTRQGGLGPALTPDRLEGRSVESLTEIILQGVPDTPMPPWGRFLSRREAVWLARQLKEGSGDASH